MITGIINTQTPVESIKLKGEPLLFCQNTKTPKGINQDYIL